MADEPDTTRRRVLRGIGAAGAATGLSATGVGTVAATRTDEPATDLTAIVRADASETLDHVKAAGLLTDGLALTRQPTDELLDGADGVSAFRLEPETGETRRYLLATRQTEEAHVRLWIDRDAGASVADVRTADGQRRLFTDDGELSSADVSQSGCSNFCNEDGCDYRGEYVVTYELGGSCYIDYEATSCGC